MTRIDDFIIMNVNSFHALRYGSTWGIFSIYLMSSYLDSMIAFLLCHGVRYANFRKYSDQFLTVVLRGIVFILVLGDFILREHSFFLKNIFVHQ